IDLMDRADVANHPDWMVIKPFVTQASNCILPVAVVADILKVHPPISQTQGTSSIPGACSNAYQYGLDPVTLEPYKYSPAYPTDYNTVTLSQDSQDPGAYLGFDPHQVGINNGEGFAKNLGGNELPNAPPFTISVSGDYTIPLTPDWAGTFHVDYYWQDYS